MTAKLAGVLYGENSQPRSLLRDYATAMQARGWRVGGLVQEEVRDENGRRLSIDAIDVASGDRFPINRPKVDLDDKNCSLDTSALTDSSTALRRAVTQGCDLLVVEKFGDQERDGGGLMDDIFAAVAAGIPVMVSVPAYAVDQWNEVCGGLSDILPWDQLAWKRWWGAAHLYDELPRLAGPETAAQVVLGLNWTLVAGPGGCGLAHSPVKDSQGCHSVPNAGELSGRPLAELAAMINSRNPFEAAIAMAAINAGVNRLDLSGSGDNGLDMVDGAGGVVTVIGRFPGLGDRFENSRIIELNPRAEEYPESATERLVATSDAILITASALQNHSLPRILNARRPGAQVVLLGPGACLSPVLFDYGIDVLSGFVVEDMTRAAKVVAEGGAVKALKTCGRYVTLRAD
jgi:uncharacterized protein (DUF4213/DUF364 family)/nucleoside-triphosphatase THEP1